MLTAAQMAAMIDWHLGESWNQSPRATIHLFTNDITPSALTTLGDLEEADYGGYTEHTMTADYIQAVDAESGFQSILNTQLASFQGDNTMEGPQTFFGWYALAHDGTYFYAQRFPTPKTLNDETQTLLFECIVPFQPQFARK